MKRRLLNLLTAISLLLSVCVAGLWVRVDAHTLGASYVGRPTPDGRQRSYGLRADSGGIVVWAKRADGVRWPSPPGLAGFSSLVSPPERQQSRTARESTAAWRWLGFQGHGRTTAVARPDAAAAGVSLRSLLVPYWLPFLLMATLPLIRLGFAWRRRGREMAGLCRQCGYDLRATPGRCPECGMMAPAQPAA